MDDPTVAVDNQIVVKITVGEKRVVFSGLKVRFVESENAEKHFGKAMIRQELSRAILDEIARELTTDYCVRHFAETFFGKEDTDGDGTDD